MEALTNEQFEKVEELDSVIEGVQNLKEKLAHYQLNSVYLFERIDYFNPKNTWVEKTHTGFPTKYKVVYISKTGVPYLRRISVAGNPVGNAFIPPEALAIQALTNVTKNETLLSGNSIVARFIPDPEQLDAILLQEEFDPMEQHRKKSQLFNEINKHNKSISVRTGSDYNSIATFFKNLQPGDKFWTSVEKQFVIQSIVKVNREYVITCTDHNQATVEFRFKDFMYKRLYSAQPRSFRKETRSE
mgnify:CR=1 FL=1